MKITILSVGKKPRGSEEELLHEYEKRINKPWLLTWKFVAHQKGDSEVAKKVESSLLLECIPDNSLCILLDERGVDVDNAWLTDLLAPDSVAPHVVLVIGGAYGVDERVHRRANKVIKLSSLVFPHKLVRIILAEQLYRTQTILQGHPYHHS